MLVFQGQSGSCGDRQRHSGRDLDESAGGMEKSKNRWREDRTLLAAPVSACPPLNRLERHAFDPCRGNESENNSVLKHILNPPVSTTRSSNEQLQCSQAALPAMHAHITPVCFVQ